jgi:hypothetical protein
LPYVLLFIVFSQNISNLINNYMSFHEELNNLYAKKIAGKSILVNESFPPYEAGEYTPEHPTAREKMLALARSTHEETPEGTRPRVAYQGAEPGEHTWRFYLAFITKFREMSPETSVRVANVVLTQILDKLSEYPDGRFMGTNVEFREQVVKPIVARAIPEMTKGDVKVGKTYVEYIARGITEAAEQSGILKNFTEGEFKRNKPKESPITDPRTSKYSAENLDKLLGLD